MNCPHCTGPLAPPEQLKKACVRCNMSFADGAGEVFRIVYLGVCTLTSGALGHEYALESDVLKPEAKQGLWSAVGTDYRNLFGRRFVFGKRVGANFQRGTGRDVPGGVYLIQRVDAGWRPGAFLGLTSREMTTLLQAEAIARGAQRGAELPDPKAKTNQLLRRALEPYANTYARADKAGKRALLQEALEIIMGLR